jgi:hypothetical protein
MVTTRNGKCTDDLKSQKKHSKVKNGVKEKGKKEIKKEEQPDPPIVSSKGGPAKTNSTKSTPKKSVKSSDRSQSSSTVTPSATPQQSKVQDLPNSIQKSKSPDAPIKASKSTKPSSSKLSIYSEVELANYKKFKEELEQQKLESLKSMCKSNAIKISGPKSELCKRIADAKVLGVIPKCPSCGGGRPKLDTKSKTYYCPGYLEDVTFKNCHKTFNFNEIVRVPWKDS